jgi:hypothetical protein
LITLRALIQLTTTIHSNDTGITVVVVLIARVVNESWGLTCSGICMLARSRYFLST